MTQKRYATLRHPKMHPHTKFGIPTSKNIGDLDRTRKRDGHTDGLTDGRTVRLLYASQSSFGGIKTDQSLMGTLWVAKGPIFLIKTDQSLIGHSMGSQMSNISNKN